MQLVAAIAEILGLQCLLDEMLVVEGEGLVAAMVEQLSNHTGTDTEAGVV